MAAQYMADGEGVVHVMGAGIAGGEYVWCGLPVVDALVEHGNAFGDGASDHAGPATCAGCKQAIDEARESLRGVRWRLAL